MLNSEFLSSTWTSVVPAKYYAESLASYLSKKNSITKELVDSLLEVFSFRNLFNEDGDIDEEVFSRDWWYMPMQCISVNGDVLRVPAISVARALNDGVLEDQDDVCSISIDGSYYRVTLLEFVKLFSPDYMDEGKTEISIIPPFDVIVEGITLEGDTSNVIDLNWVNEHESSIVERADGDLDVGKISISQTLGLITDIVKQSTCFTVILDAVGKAAETAVISYSDITSKVANTLGVTVSEVNLSEAADACIDIATDSSMNMNDRTNMLISYIMHGDDNEQLTSQDNLTSQDGICYDLANYSGTPISSMYGISSAQSWVDNAYCATKTVINTASQLICQLFKKGAEFATEKWKQHVEPLYEAKDFVESDEKITDNYVDIPTLVGNTNNINSAKFDLKTDNISEFILDSLGKSKEMLLPFFNSVGGGLVVDSMELADDKRSYVLNLTHDGIVKSNVSQSKSRFEFDFANSNNFTVHERISRPISVATVYADADGNVFSDMSDGGFDSTKVGDRTVKLTDQSGETLCVRQGQAAYVVQADLITSKISEHVDENLTSALRTPVVQPYINHLSLRMKHEFFEETSESLFTFGLGEFASVWTARFSGYNPKPIITLENMDGSVISVMQLFSQSDLSYGNLEVDLLIPSWKEGRYDNLVMKLDFYDIRYIFQVTPIPYYDHNDVVTSLDIQLDQIGDSLIYVRETGKVNTRYMPSINRPDDPYSPNVYKKHEYKVVYASVPEVITTVTLPGYWRVMDVKGYTRLSPVGCGDASNNQFIDFAVVGPAYWQISGLMSLNSSEAKLNAEIGRLLPVYRIPVSVTYSLSQSGGIVWATCTEEYVIDPFCMTCSRVTSDHDKWVFSQDVLYEGSARYMYQWINSNTTIRYNTREVTDLSDAAQSAFTSAIKTPIDDKCAITMHTHFMAIQMSRSGDIYAAALHLNPVQHQSVLCRDGRFRYRLNDTSGMVEYLDYNDSNNVITTLTPEEFCYHLVDTMSNIERADISPYTLGESGDVMVWRDLEASLLLTDMYLHMLSYPTHETTSILNNDGYVWRIFNEPDRSVIGDDNVSNMDLVSLLRTNVLEGVNLDLVWSSVLGAITLNKVAVMDVWFKITGEFPPFIPYMVGYPLNKPRWHISTDAELANIADRAIKTLLTVAAVIAAIYLGVKLNKMRQQRLRRLNLKSEARLGTCRSTMLSKDADVNSKQSILDGLKKEYADAVKGGDQSVIDDVLTKVNKAKDDLSTSKAALATAIADVEKQERRVMLTKNLTQILGYKPRNLLGTAGLVATPTVSKLVTSMAQNDEGVSVTEDSMLSVVRSNHSTVIGIMNGNQETLGQAMSSMSAKIDQQSTDTKTIQRSFDDMKEIINNDVSGGIDVLNSDITESLDNAVTLLDESIKRLASDIKSTDITFNDRD